MFIQSFKGSWSLLYAISFLSSLPISVLRSLDREANKFYDSTHQLYDAALLTSFILNSLRPYIDSKINHKHHFIKIPFINKGIKFNSLPSIFKDTSVTCHTSLLQKYRSADNLLQI